MESIDSQIPKRQKLVTFSKKYGAICKKHRGPHKSYNSVTVIILILMVLLSIGVGAQETQEEVDMPTSITQRKVSAKWLISPRSFERK